MARWQIGEWSFDTTARSLRRGEEAQNLPLKVSEVLRLLAERRGEVVTTDELIATVWEGNHYTGPRGVRNAIWSLRRMLDAPSIDTSAIDTIAKTGYRLTLPAHEHAAVTQVLSAPAQDDESADATRASGRQAPFIGDPRHAREASKPRVLVALLAAAALTISAVVWVRTREAPPAPQRPKLVTFYDGMEEFPAVSPNGQWLAFTWERENRPSQIFLKSLRDPAAPLRQFTLGSGNEVRPVWSADGADIAFARTEPSGGCEVFIRNVATLAEHAVAPCFYERLHQVLDWSPNGQLLAIAHRDRGADTVSIYLHDLTRQTERRLTTAPAGAQDSQLAWSPDGREIAFIRRVFTAGAVYVVNVATGRSRPLTFDHAPIYGLTWSRKDRRVIFNSMRDGAFALWSVRAAGGKPKLVARLETPFNLTALAGTPETLIISQHKTAEYLETRSRTTGQLIATIASGGRDMYAHWSQSQRRLLYTSNRTGRFQLWMSDTAGNDARVVDGSTTLLSTFAWSPAGPQYAATGREPGTPHDQLYIGDAKSGALKALTADAFDYRNPTWEPDGRALLVSSNRGDAVEIWRYEIDSNNFTRLTYGGGLHAQQAGDWLYYTRPDLAGLWGRPLKGTNTPKLIVPDLAADDWGSWQIDKDTVYYVTRTADSDLVVARSLDSDDRKVIVTLPRNAIRIYKSLTLAGDDEIVITMLGRRQVDIVALNLPD